MAITPNDPASFSPVLQGYTGQGAFRFWCQTVLPLVYDDSLSYYELLNKVVNYLNNVISDVGQVETNVGEIVESYNDLEAYVNSNYLQLVETYNQLENYVNEYFENLDVQDEIEESVSDWLDDHPEATTTVQDGSLTEAKLSESLALKTIKDYATPEMFGAKGDGVTDDTQAWQMAVDSGFSVKATKKLYKCGKITVTNNIEIDCNGADFICLSDILFDCKGSVVTSLTNESDYTSNQIDYNIIDSDYSNYTGFAFLKGDNNFDTARSYYLGGFMGYFVDGRLSCSYPVDVTNTTIDIINPITVCFSHIGNIEHLSSGAKSINVLYGVNCAISGCKIESSSVCIFLQLEKCFNCILTNSIIKLKYGSSGTNSYIVNFGDCSFCSIDGCYLYNHFWHCATTGGTYLSYKNQIRSSELQTYNAVSFEDHANALGTEIIDCTCSCVGLSGLSVIRDCIITSTNTANGSCYLRFYAKSNIEASIYTANNIRFLPKNGASDVGVRLSVESLQANKTYYIKECIFDNIKCYNKNAAGSIRFSFQSDCQYHIHNIKISDCNLDILCGVTSSSSVYINITNYKLTLSNSNSYRYNNERFIYFGDTAYIFNEVVLSDVSLYYIIGQFSKLRFSNLYVSTTIASTCVVTEELYGTGLHSNIGKLALLNPQKVRISDYTDGTTQYLFVAKDNNGNLYSQTYLNGEIVARQITN